VSDTDSKEMADAPVPADNAAAEKPASKPTRSRAKAAPEGEKKPAAAETAPAEASAAPAKTDEGTVAPPAKAEAAGKRSEGDKSDDAGSGEKAKSQSGAKGGEGGKPSSSARTPCSCWTWPRSWASRKASPARASRM
jgi:hypothetical protein